MSAHEHVLQTAIQTGTKARRGNASIIVLSSTRVALAAMCLVAGGITLGTAPAVDMVHAVGRGVPLVNVFNAVGVGLYLHYLTGTIEVAAAIALLGTSTAPYAAVLLIPTMIMAIANNVFMLHGSVVGPVVLMIVAAFVAWATRKQQH